MHQTNKGAGNFPLWPRARLRLRERTEACGSRWPPPPTPLQARGHTLPSEASLEPHPSHRPGSRSSQEEVSPLLSGGTQRCPLRKPGVSLPLNYLGHLPHGHSWTLIHGRTAYSENLSERLQ